MNMRLHNRARGARQTIVVLLATSLAASACGDDSAERVSANASDSTRPASVLTSSGGSEGSVDSDEGMTVASGRVVVSGSLAEGRATTELHVASNGSYRIDYPDNHFTAYDAVENTLVVVSEGSFSRSDGTIGAGPYAYGQQPLRSDMLTAFRSLASSMVELEASGEAERVEVDGRWALRYTGELTLRSPAERFGEGPDEPERYQISAIVDEETLLPLEVTQSGPLGDSAWTLTGLEESAYSPEMFTAAGVTDGLADGVQAENPSIVGSPVDLSEQRIEGQPLILPSDTGRFDLDEALFYEGRPGYRAGRSVDGEHALRDVVAVTWRDGYHEIVALVASSAGREWADPYGLQPLSVQQEVIEVDTSRGPAQFNVVHGFGVESHAWGNVGDQFLSIGGDISVVSLVALLETL